MFVDKVCSTCKWGAIRCKNPRSKHYEQTRSCSDGCEEWKHYDPEDYKQKDKTERIKVGNI